MGTCRSTWLVTCYTRVAVQFGVRVICLTRCVGWMVGVLVSWFAWLRVSVYARG